MTRDELLKESRAAGLESISERTAICIDRVISAIMEAFPDKEERDDVLRRQAAIMAQLMTALDQIATMGFEAMVEDLLASGDQTQAEFTRNVERIADAAIERFQNEH